MVDLLRKDVSITLKAQFGCRYNFPLSDSFYVALLNVPLYGGDSDVHA